MRSECIIRHCSGIDLSYNWGGGEVGVSPVKPSNCFRRLEKLVLPSVFDVSFILHDVKLAELSNNSFE